jgi:hypothetical protein
MYLRETRRTTKDGTSVAYLQLAHNERHPVTRVSTVRVLHNFGRVDQLDKNALRRLVDSLSRFLDPADAVAAAHGGAEAGVEVLDTRRLGAVWVLDRLWERVGIAAAIRRVAARRKLDAAVTERIVFALVAQRACEPASKLEATKWVAQRVFIDGVPGFGDDAAYRSMDFLLDALGEIAGEVFSSVAHLLNLDVSVIFVDTTSTYWQVETAEQTVGDAAGDPGEPPGGEQDGGAAGAPRPLEAGARRFGHSKDHREDLPQVVIAMAVTREGVPVRCWTFAGDTADQAIVRSVKDDLDGWDLRRMVWVTDRGFASAQNRAYLTRGGGHYIHAEKLRATNTEAAAALSRPGRYRSVAGNLRVKEVQVAPGGDGDGDGGARAQRFVICQNPEAGARDAAVRDRLVEHLRGLIDGSDGWSARRRDEFVGSLRSKPGLRRYLRRTPGGLLRIDQAAITAETHLDGKWLLRTSDLTLDPEDLAAAYKQLLAVERGWRDMKGALGLRPVFHYREDRIRAHVQLCWLALLLIRIAENATDQSWRCLRHELDRLALVTLATSHGTVAQRSQTTHAQRTILSALELAEPPKFFDFAPTTD